MATSTPLVSTAWLREHLDDENLVVLDASVFLDPEDGAGTGGFRSGLYAFGKDGHIPGARFADLFTQFSDPDAPFPFSRPSRQKFEAAAGRLGVDPETHVVIYDNLVGQWAARLWWVFRSFGHRRVSVLDGGLRKYLREGGALEARLAPYAPAVYRSSKETKHVAFRRDVEAIVNGAQQGRLVCFLQREDYAGAISVRKRPGHIPGSVNLPFNELLDSERNTLLSPAELRSVFSSVAPLDGGLIVTYCGGGIASTLGALALSVIGYDNTLEYDGSLAEWSANDDLPLETGF